MALLFIDGFDYYTSIMDRWTTTINSGGVPAAGSARSGAQGLSVPNLNRAQSRTLPSSYATLVAGTAFKFAGTSGVGPWTVIGFAEGSGNHVFLGWDFALNKLGVYRDGTLIGSLGPTVLNIGVWYYLEFRATIHDTTGSAEVRINGTTELTHTNVDTRSGGTGVINTVWIGPGASGGGCHYDDFYVLDTTGGSPNDTFLGDVTVETLYPNANGNSSQFDGSDGNQVDNYLLVDEATPNDDTDYVESPDFGDKDTYGYSDLATTSGTIYAVQPVPRFRKTAAGSVSAVSVARLSATEVDSSAKIVLDNYIYSPDIRPTKPGGGVWTIADVNNTEFGLKVAS